MKYNFFRGIIVLAFVFAFTFITGAQDSLSVDSVLTAEVINDTVDVTMDSVSVQSDTVLTSAEIISDTGIVKSEGEEPVQEHLVTEASVESETASVAQMPVVGVPFSQLSEIASSSVNLANENAAGQPISTPIDVKRVFIENKTLRWFFTNIFYLIFLCVSLALIIATVFFFSKKKDGRRFLTTTRLSVLDKMVQRGCRYIESNYMDPQLTVETVCRELVTGEAYMDALFVKEIGINVQDFIIQVRVNSVKNVLAENPALDLNNIYVQCGFKNNTEARTHFTRLCGVGIEEYRKSLPR
ncbi:MAG: AraC family transcriptional regulator [Chitinispirillales bacterium]|jgi:AraC-like DNA-binding protein|nr:AraC family transcriptional regulator [Chitinispirillales bacterium]